MHQMDGWTDGRIDKQIDRYIDRQHMLKILMSEATWKA